MLLGESFSEFFDDLIHKIPIIKTIYKSSKQLLNILKQKPDSVERVVLIDFPSPEMKTVGFVTRILKDDETGEELAAVYVPTTPNPTSGYLEVVPIDRITPTNWNVEEAMTFIVSGGAVAPDTMVYNKSSNKQNPSSDSPQN